MNSLIQCSHADFGYENQDAVVDVTMEVNPGDYVCIVGENGSGKSTLMKGMLGLLKPTKGTISVSDELKKSGIGYLPQQTAAQKDFPATVGEVVLSGCLSRRGNKPFYSGKEKALAEKNMERLGIAELAGQCYRDLSGGQQQRTLIARALCADYRPGPFGNPGILRDYPKIESKRGRGDLNGIPRYCKCGEAGEKDSSFKERGAVLRHDEGVFEEQRGPHLSGR